MPDSHNLAERLTEGEKRALLMSTKDWLGGEINYAIQAIGLRNLGLLETSHGYNTDGDPLTSFRLTPAGLALQSELRP